MRFIHCTQKLINEIDPKINSKGEERIVNGLGDWYANIFCFENKNTLAFMNVKTLYSFFMTDVYMDDIDNFGKTFIIGLITSLENNGIEREVIRRFISEYTDIDIVKTRSRSVLASMNDHISHYYRYMEKGSYPKNKDINEFNKSITQMPLGGLKYKTPLEKLKELIDLDYR